MSPDLCCPEGQTCAGSWADGIHCPINCEALCNKVTGSLASAESCSYQADGRVGYMCGACGVGRIPMGTHAIARGGTLGERLAYQAYYEAASVYAFEALAAALADADAPRDLIARVAHAARDERHHAATFAHLAAVHGVSSCSPLHRERSVSLFELALENATEGCVRETLGAFVALHQSKHAERPELAAAFASIAGDELEHAMLSWDLMAWFDTVLPEAQRTMMHSAYREARSEAMSSVTCAQDALDVQLGLPSPEQASQMFAALQSELTKTEPLLQAA